MLADAKINYDNDLKLKFKKSFINFCVKAPIPIYFELSEKGVEVKVLKENKKFKKRTFSLKENVQLTIFDIKKWLVNEEYPRLVQFVRKKINYTSEELKEILENNKNANIEDLLSNNKKEILEQKEYIILRFLELAQEVFLLDISENIVKKYKMGLLKEKIRENISPMTYQEFYQKYEKGKEEIMGDIFFEKSVYIFDVVKNDKNNDDFLWIKKKFY